MAEAAEEAEPHADEPAAPDNAQYVHLRYLDEGDSYADMEPQTYEHDTGDGHETDMLYECMEEYPGNWPGGSP